MLLYCNATAWHHAIKLGAQPEHRGKSINYVVTIHKRPYHTNQIKQITNERTGVLFGIERQRNGTNNNTIQYKRSKEEKRVKNPHTKLVWQMVCQEPYTCSFTTCASKFVYFALDFLNVKHWRKNAKFQSIILW